MRQELIPSPSLTPFLPPSLPSQVSKSVQWRGFGQQQQQQEDEEDRLSWEEELTLMHQAADLFLAPATDPNLAFHGR